MTQGQMMFLLGVVLLIATIVLAIIFLIKKPRYSPEQFDGTGSETTFRLRNGYPTDRLTKRYPSASGTPVHPPELEEETERLQELSEVAEETERLSKSEELGEETVRPQGVSDHVVEKGHSQELDFAEETEPLQDLSEPSEKTEHLTATTEFGEATEALRETEDLLAQMKSPEEETQRLNEDN